MATVVASRRSFHIPWGLYQPIRLHHRLLASQTDQPAGGIDVDAREPTKRDGAVGVGAIRRCFDQHGLVAKELLAPDERERQAALAQASFAGIGNDGHHTLIDEGHASVWTAENQSAGAAIEYQLNGLRCQTDAEGKTGRPSEKSTAVGGPKSWAWAVAASPNHKRLFA